jgi:uncharacterized protein (TIGR00251 family)
MNIPFKKSKKGVTIEVRVEPRSSKACISGVTGDVLKVKLTAPPVEGEANRQLIEVISEELGIAKRRINIVKGLKSKNKVVEIEGM